MSEIDEGSASELGAAFNNLIFEHRKEVKALRERVKELETGLETALDHAYGFANDYTDALNELAALKEAHRWIPVSERLPEEFKEVQVWDVDDDRPISAYLERDVDGVSFCDVRTGGYLDSTHWQPLPPGPESVPAAKRESV